MSEYISLLTELRHSDHILSYKHLAPNGAKTFLISNSR
jgi:hypothetical protein